MPSTRKKPILAIIGAGRVGRALGRKLHRRGWRIGVVVTRSIATARAAARAIGAGDPQPNIGPAVLNAGVVLIATPDMAIASVARELVKLGGPGKRPPKNDWPGKIVLHTCGALDRGVLRPLARRAAATGSLHPLQTFSLRRPPQLDGCVCAIEGDAAALRCAMRICRELSCIPVRVPAGKKAAYHAAAALAAGHVLGLLEAATRIFEASGFARQQAVRALLPLTRQTLANFERSGARASWTGPASRGDWKTVALHLTALRRFPREYRSAYAAVTRLCVALLSRKPSSRRRLERP
jgi:predicted short-subunit dehydrogenase-like oxidoreductase (DUF2520 family)